MQLKSKSQKDTVQAKSSSAKNSNILAWILLIVGLSLCLIACAIYIVLFLNSKDDGGDAKRDVDIALSREVEEPLAELNGDFDFTFKAVGSFSENPDPQPVVKQGCHEVSCRIDCSDNYDLYVETAEVMNSTSCEVITSLVVTNQLMESIAESWIDMDTIVLKIVLMNSKISKIKSGAFSSSLFAKVFHMTWNNLQVDDVSSGALLGLYALRKLEIDSKLQDISMTFLQPVQLTLTHLRINSGISFYENPNVFQNIYLAKLIHLDLSSNYIRGPLSGNIFTGTPSVTYLYLKYCLITSIEEDAFQQIAHKLILIDLKHNLLTHISDTVFRGVSNRLLLDLEPNNWKCDCHLLSMINFFGNNQSQFISLPYCRYPYHLYGKLFDELTAEDLNCQQYSNNATITTSKIPMNLDRTTPEMTAESIYEDEIDPLPTNGSPFGAILQFSCLEPIEVNDSSRIELETVEHKEKLYNSGKLVFHPPVYDLDLDLLDNLSVRANIDSYSLSVPMNIIWFTDVMEGVIYNMDSNDIEYECMQYEQPYLIIEPLQQNHTYTFCMLPIGDLVVSPLFCQPLFVPAAKTTNNTHSDVWIAESEKHFTIAMLCLIFLISTIIGAILAYLGIKSYPNLLEGSKNVLVVKEMDKSCYVSTITESNVVKTSVYGENSLPTDKKKSSLPKKSEPEISSIYDFGMTTTTIEESVSNIEFQSLGYEMPKQFKKLTRKPCNINQELERPNSPPPLPKRNSSVSS